MKKPKLSVRLSCLPLDMDPDRRWPRPPGLPPLDRCFDERAALADYQDRRRKAEEKVRLSGHAVVSLSLLIPTLTLTSPNPTPFAQLKVAREGKLRRARRKRQVDYDKWRAVNHLEAERLLKEGGRVGDWIFRPSGTGGWSGGLDWLCLSLSLVTHTD